MFLENFINLLLYIQLHFIFHFFHAIHVDVNYFHNHKNVNCAFTMRTNKVPQTICELFGSRCDQPCYDPRVSTRRHTSHLTPQRSCIRLLAFIYHTCMKSSAKMRLFTKQSIRNSFIKRKNKDSSSQAILSQGHNPYIVKIIILQYKSLVEINQKYNIIVLEHMRSTMRLERKQSTSQASTS